MSFDLVLRGGRLYGGSGLLGIRGDLAIDNGRIAAVGDVSGSTKREIDVSGLAVAPGFIDIKTHSDFTLPINSKAESKVRQGVTTEVIGHCGFSVAPVLPGRWSYYVIIFRRRHGCRSASRVLRNISTVSGPPR
jgi:N-acyl-D-amino-acid deacylase